LTQRHVRKRDLHINRMFDYEQRQEFCSEK
jgi:hypothetical protein